MFSILKKLPFFRWELFHTTASVDEHFAMLEKLRSHGTEFKTKGINFGGGYGGAGGFDTVYHIYTRKEDEPTSDDFNDQ